MQKESLGIGMSKNLELEEVRKITAQIAHDIRSPLSALAIISRDLLDIDQSKQDILRLAIGRIQGIANNLKKVSESSLESSFQSSPKIFVKQSLLKMIKEKQVELSLAPAVELSLDTSHFEGDMACVADSVEFSSMISNLINNAIEACEGGGQIKIVLSKTHGGVQIEIRDNGIGIPLEKLSLIGERGVSFGKIGGSGLGVYHAKRFLEEWGGSFRIISSSGRGTLVLIALRQAGQ